MAKELFNWTEISQRAFEAYNAKDFDTCKTLLQNVSNKIVQQNKNDARLAYAWMMIGSCLYQEPQYDKAVQYLERAVKICRQHRETNLVATLYWLGCCFFKQKNWTKAYDMFIEAASLYELPHNENNNRSLEVLTYAASSLGHSGRLNEAVTIFKKH